MDRCVQPVARDFALDSFARGDRKLVFFYQVVSLAKTKNIASFFILSALLNIKGKRNESEWYEIIGELSCDG